MKEPQAILNVLNYSIGAKRKTFGHGFDAAYHTVRLGDEVFQGQRDIPTRLAHIDYDLTDKVVMDLGCNAGGMLLELAPQIKMGVGIDYSSKVINGANAIKAYNNINNVSFYTFDLDQEPLNVMNNFTGGEKVDVYFVLAIALWVKQWKEVVLHCSQNAPVLIYESNGKEGFQAAQQTYLSTLYKDVKMLATESDDDNRKKASGKLRQLFICTN